jgi:diguanylate cyclase (GGDEF)-like protein
LVATIVGFALTIAEWLRSRSREVAMFFVAWGMLMVGFVLYIGQKFGWFPVTPLTEHAIELGAILEVLLLALGLAEKINTERQQRLETQQQMLDMQIRANEELDQKVRERTEELELLNGQLQLASVTDSLTQVKNRRYFDKKLPSEYRRSFREKSWVSLLMMDVDHFKQFNDEHGHQAGDKVLQEVAKAVEQVVKRPSDAVSRYGGEEFAVLLPNTDLPGAALVAERIREQIEMLEIQWHGKALKVTASIGIAGCIPAHRDEFELLTKQADNYLYVAKEQGRNRVIYEGNDPSAANSE